MSSTELRLQPAGSLVRPGPVGRLARLLLGVGCLLALADLVTNMAQLVAHPLASFPDLAIPAVVAAWVFNYVVNIGFGLDWGPWPRRVALAGLLLAGAAAWLVSGSFDHPLLGVPLVALLGLTFAHLGVAFVLAAVLATPGCEMRAPVELLGHLRGRAVAEHHCPASMITRLDAWEARRRARRQGGAGKRD